IEEKLAEAEKEIRKSENATKIQEFMKNIDFFKSMIISCKAVIRYAERYSKLARWMSEKEENPQRKKELLKISETCTKVPANPAETFQEALEVYVMIWGITHSIDHECHGTSERLDQFLWPYYKNDVINKKNLNREQATELMECCWIKINEIGRLLPRSTRLSHQGTNNNNATTIGGQNSDGTDASNELTEVILDA